MLAGERSASLLALRSSCSSIPESHLALIPGISSFPLCVGAALDEGSPYPGSSLPAHEIAGFLASKCDW